MFFLPIPDIWIPFKCYVKNNYLKFFSLKKVMLHQLKSGLSDQSTSEILIRTIMLTKLNNG